MSGYKPFVGAGTPDVIWSEGTIEAALALDRLDIDSAWSSAAVASIAATATGSVAGPVGADREVISPVWGEYHTWPTSAATSWLLIAAGREQLLLTR